MLIVNAPCKCIQYLVASSIQSFDTDGELCPGQTSAGIAWLQRERQGIDAAALQEYVQALLSLEEAEKQVASIQHELDR